MKEVLRTNDPVRLSFAESLLRDAGIKPIALDEGMSALHGGALPFIPRRLMVVDEQAHQARTVLEQNLPEEE